MNDVYLSLGSNIGDREKYLNMAINALKSHYAIELKGLSNIYETKPIGPIKQKNFLNMAIILKTSLNPNSLLKCIWLIESDLRRERLIKWGPRTIDIDILLFGNEIIEDIELIIPHKEMFKRAFVLLPLSEILSHSVVMGVDILGILEDLDLSEVWLYKKTQKNLEG